MRLELRINNEMFTCDAKSPQLIAEWFKERIPDIITLNATDLCQIKLWAQSHEEYTTMQNSVYGKSGMISINMGEGRNALRKLGELFLEMAGTKNNEVR